MTSPQPEELVEAQLSKKQHFLRSCTKAQGYKAAGILGFAVVAGAPVALLGAELTRAGKIYKTMCECRGFARAMLTGSASCMHLLAEAMSHHLFMIPEESCLLIIGRDMGGQREAIDLDCEACASRWDWWLVHTCMHEGPPAQQAINQTAASNPRTSLPPVTGLCSLIHIRVCFFLHGGTPHC